MSTSNIIYSVLSFIGLILLSIPLHWQLKARNIGTCIYSIWTALSLLSYCINSIIWNKDAANRAPVWCDISSRLISSSWVGIPAASLCINRGLFNIITLQTITRSKEQKRQAIVVDLVIGVGIPVLATILRCGIEIPRFDIFQEIGCYPGVQSNLVAFVFVYSFPLILSLISAYYAIRSVIIRRRTEEDLKTHLFTTSDSNASLWYRLLALASIEVVIVLPTITYVFIKNVTLADWRYRWNSWNDNSSHISSVVESYPSILWKGNLRNMVAQELPRWTRVFFAFNFFVLFGLTEEARCHYKMAWDSVMKFIGCSSITERVESLRFNTFLERSSIRGSRTGIDTDISISSGRGNDNLAPPDTVPEQGAVLGEALMNLRGGPAL